jgi:hypothetical protein
MSMGNKRVPGKNPFKITAHNKVIRIEIAMKVPNKLNYFCIIEYLDF